MLSLARQIATVVFLLLALRGFRWAYAAFLIFALLYFPAQVGFELHPKSCELLVDARLAAFSFTNFPHIILFALFFVVSAIHAIADASSMKSALVFAVIATLAMGVMLELAEGATGSGHCRLRDLLPDTAGLLLGAAAVWLGSIVLVAVRDSRD